MVYCQDLTPCNHYKLYLLLARLSLSLSLSLPVPPATYVPVLAAITRRCFPLPVAKSLLDDSESGFATGTWSFPRASSSVRLYT